MLAPLVKARKGFHTEVARWAERHGFEELLVDGKWVRTDQFQKLERFREHTIDVLVGERGGARAGVPELVKRALEIGKGTVRLLDAKNVSHILSTEMSCPGCGQSFEELDPRLFSFNSPHGWCRTATASAKSGAPPSNPRLESQLEIEMDQERQHESLEDGEARPCPACCGARLNEIARNVRLSGRTIDEITDAAARQRAGLAREAEVHRHRSHHRRGHPAGDRAAAAVSWARSGSITSRSTRSAKTLSGGESQRIRLAAQLGSNLRGVLYVLDEPTIGLHPRDNGRLLDTLEALKAKGNSLVIVEHDEDTMRRADHIIDLGPGAGRAGRRDRRRGHAGADPEGRALRHRAAACAIPGASDARRAPLARGSGALARSARRRRCTI